MRNKNLICVICPKNSRPVSTDDIAMCELLLNELVLSPKDHIKFHVNTELRLVECNCFKVKKILDVLLKAGRLPFVKEQILELIHKDVSSDDMLGRLKFLIEGERVSLVVRETKPGSDFTWDVIHGSE